MTIFATRDAKNSSFTRALTLIFAIILLSGFSFGEIPDLELLPPLCGQPTSNYVVFGHDKLDYFNVFDVRKNEIKTVTIPVKSSKRSPLLSYDDYIFFKANDKSYRYDIAKERFQEFPYIHGTVYLNYDTNILIRNLYNLKTNIVQLQKEKYDPEKKTFAILKTWPKFIDSELVGNGNYLIITNKEKTFLIDVETGFEKTLKGSMKYCFRNDRQIFVETRGVYDGTHLYQIDLAFRGRTIDYAIIANSQILKEFTTGAYRRIGMNKKTGYLYSVFTNRADNSLEIITIENEKMIKKIYYLPKELPYKFIYEKEKNNFIEGEFYLMYGDLIVLYFNMDNNMHDTRFIFLDTKKYDQLPENEKKESIVFEFKDESWLFWVFFQNDKFYITTDTRIYCYDYDYNLLWKKLCPKYRKDIQYNGSTFSCYSIFNNETLEFDMYVKEFENEKLKNLYLISPGFVSDIDTDFQNFVLSKHGILSLHCDSRHINLARIRLFKPDIYAPAYDLVSKNGIIGYTSWKHDGEDLITLEGYSSDQKFTEIFNIKLGKFVE
jgi:hypothetical protein